nr:hypothetical protein [Microlunatus endophyticus]
MDAAEAARRIDALSTSEPAEPVTEAPTETVDADAWAATTDRPQTPGATRESFRTEPAESASAASGPTSGSSPSGSSSSGSSPSGSPSAGAGGPRGWLGRSRVPATGNGTNGVEKLSVRAVGRRVRIVGEPSVATVSADGPHVLRRNGSVLEVSSDGEFGASIDGFQLLRATRSLDDFRSLGLGKELLLKVNPALLVDVEVTAGSLNTEGVPRLGSVRVTAGGARLLDVSEIADALIQAGQATVKAAIISGRSRIRVESGSLSLQLADSSNVTVSTDSQLGKVSWGGAHAGFTGDEVVMGNGSARLEVEVVMGHASVKAGTVPAASGTAASGAA